MPIKSSAKNYSAKNFTTGLRTTSKMVSKFAVNSEKQISDRISANLL